MNGFIRASTGLLGLVALALVAVIWLDPDGSAPKFGLSLSGDIGRAAIRADIAGLFLALGILSLLAAIYQNADHAKYALILTAAVLIGRTINFLTSGMLMNLLPPIGIELVMMAIYYAGIRVWKVNNA